MLQERNILGKTGGLLSLVPTISSLESNFPSNDYRNPRTTVTKYYVFSLKMKDKIIITWGGKRRMLSTKYWYESLSPATSCPTAGMTENEYTSYLHEENFEFHLTGQIQQCQEREKTDKTECGTELGFRCHDIKLQQYIVYILLNYSIINIVYNLCVSQYTGLY